MMNESFVSLLHPTPPCTEPMDTMRDIGEGTIRRISWVDLAPVVFLARLPGIAGSPRILFLATIGVLLTLVLGLSIGFLLPPSVDRPLPAARQSLDPVAFQHQPGFSRLKSTSLRTGRGVQEIFHAAVHNMFVPWNVFLTAAGDGLSPHQLCHGKNFSSLLWFAGLFVIWTYFGGAICRTAALNLTVRENLSLEAMNRFIGKCGFSTFFAVLIALVFIACCGLFLQVAGLAFSWNIVVLDYIAALGFPLVLLVGLLLAILLVGLVLAWPLMFAAVAVDGSDAFDAVSRMYSYVYQRPFHYLVYVLVALFVGAISYLFVALFLDIAVVAAIHGCGPHLQPLADAGSLASLLQPGALENLSVPEYIAACWVGLFQVFKIAYVFGFFWTAAVAIYLLLRKSVDNAPMEEVCRLEGANARPLTREELS